VYLGQLPPNSRRAIAQNDEHIAQGCLNSMWGFVEHESTGLHGHRREQLFAGF